MILGFGVFLLGIIGIISIMKWGTFQEKVKLEMVGYLPALRWGYLILGIVSLIVNQTI